MRRVRPAERLVALETAGAAGRRDMTLIEMVRDEAREAAELMQRVYERASRADARAVPTGD